MNIFLIFLLVKLKQVHLFSDCLLKYSNNEPLLPKHKRKQKVVTKFLIHRALLIHPDFSSTKKKTQVVDNTFDYADRKLGTDGILYLLQKDIEKLESNYTSINYGDAGGLRYEYFNIGRDIGELNEDLSHLFNRCHSFKLKISESLENSKNLISCVEAGELFNDNTKENLSDEE